MITSLSYGLRTGFRLLAAEEHAGGDIHPNVIWQRNLLLQSKTWQLSKKGVGGK